MASTANSNQRMDEGFAFEAWKHHASIGGADKDRMIQIATWLLGFSAAIVGFTFNHAVKSNIVVEPLAVIGLSSIGLTIAFASAFITLLYGGYANWNWAKADQIAKEYHWDLLDPMDSPFSKWEDSTKKAVLVAWSLRQAEPKPTYKQLAPVFWLFFVMSLVSFLIHVLILLWSLASWY